MSDSVDDSVADSDLRTPSNGALGFAERLQARVDAIEADPAASGRAARGAFTAAPSEAPPPDAPPPQDRALLEHLQRELALLRRQLEAAFDEMDERMGVFEERASRAEMRAATAEGRAGDAVEIIERLQRTLAAVEPENLAETQRRLREALERMRSRFANPIA